MRDRKDKSTTNDAERALAILISNGAKSVTLEDFLNLSTFRLKILRSRELRTTPSKNRTNERRHAYDLWDLTESQSGTLDIADYENPRTLYIHESSAREQFFCYHLAPNCAKKRGPFVVFFATKSSPFFFQCRGNKTGDANLFSFDEILSKLRRTAAFYIKKRKGRMLNLWNSGFNLNTC